MIEDVANAIVQALESARTGTPFDMAHFRIGLAGPEPPRFGVTVSLVRFGIDANLRNSPVDGPPRSTPEGSAPRESTPALQLHFAVTPWAPDAATQLALLDWLLRAVEATPVITVARATVRVTLLSPGLPDELRVWRALYPGQPLHPSIHLQARTAATRGESGD